MKARASRESGFTLIEVLVGLALSSMILVSLNLAMTAIRQSVDRTRDSLGSQAALSAAADVFSGDVARIARIRRGTAEQFSGYVFEGSADQMTYPLFEYRGVATGALYLARLRVQDAGGQTQLIRERARIEPGGENAMGAEWKDAVVLLEGPFDIALAYRAPRAGARSWEDAWASAESMPEQVRLSITDRKTGKLRLPVLVQALQVDAEVECAALGPGCKNAPAPAEAPK